MDRRKFFSFTGAGATAVAAGSLAFAEATSRSQAGAAAGSYASTALPPLKARLGHQFGSLTDRSAAWVARYGVDGICTSPIVTDPTRLYPTPEEKIGRAHV